MELTREMIERACDAQEPRWRSYNMSLWTEVQIGLAAAVGYRGPWIEARRV